jgi:hypothetical protein
VCRRLVDAGVHVAPVLTDDAQRFVGALTFSALASEPARTSLFGGPEPIPHTRLGQAADLVVVAPATAKLLGKYAAGISDDLLTATLLATRAPVLVAPAMNVNMWQNPITQSNLARLLGSDGDGRFTTVANWRQPWRDALLRAATRLPEWPVRSIVVALGTWGSRRLWRIYRHQFAARNVFN